MAQPGQERFARYDRQIRFGPWGLAGQEKLARARVAVVGCGGLGCVIATHLVRAGIGFIRLIDRERVSLDNLQRQILFLEEDAEAGRFKAAVAAERLRAANSEVKIEGLVESLGAENAGRLLADVDIIVDGTDNFPARFVINEAAVKAGIPWVYGGVSGASGMTMAIVPGEGPCLRCLFGEGTEGKPGETAGPPAAEAVGPEAARVEPTPAVLNTVVATIASLECTEVYKLLLEPESRNRGLVCVDLWGESSWSRVEVERDPSCPVCGACIS